MNTKLAKLIILLLIAGVISALFSCASDSQTKDSENSVADNPEQNEIQAAEEPAEPRLYPELEAKDFGGYEFKFLTRNVPGWGMLAGHRDIYAEETNGDLINDAVYARNRKIEEKYNIKIKQIDVELSTEHELTAAVGNAVKANDDIYDVICLTMYRSLMPLMTSGYLTDLYEVPNLDLSKPWWNQGAVRDLSILGKLFTVQGDLLVINNDYMGVLTFSKPLIEDYALESPYDIVKRGEWTFDKLIEMSRDVSRDLNGDGIMRVEDDLFGFIFNADVNTMFIVTGGEKIVSKDENDYPVISFGSERCYRILDAINEIMLDELNFVHAHRYGDKYGTAVDQHTCMNLMAEKKVLFLYNGLNMAEVMRSVEIDFGIIPLPKLDKQQKSYYTPYNTYCTVGISVPIVASDPGRTGMLLEDLAAESRYTLQPAYYEINLRTKFARDDESQEMLDIILNNTAHDIGYVYDFGGFATEILWFGRQQKTNYVSHFESNETKIQKAIDKIIEELEKLG
ncbi:MAG: extracellular solute-binding protein [Oscillospiraceae bacterium]|nr:extracellular solute-binding protein [Oscillospiraceae bacterium]